MQTQRYIDINDLARLTGLPLGWLRREADEGRLPCLRVGRRRMFDAEAVRDALKARAERPAAARPEVPRE